MASTIIPILEIRHANYCVWLKLLSSILTMIKRRETVIFFLSPARIITLTGFLSFACKYNHHNNIKTANNIKSDHLNEAASIVKIILKVNNFGSDFLKLKNRQNISVRYIPINGTTTFTTCTTFITSCTLELKITMKFIEWAQSNSFSKLIMRVL